MSYSPIDVGFFMGEAFFWDKGVISLLDSFVNFVNYTTYFMFYTKIFTCRWSRRVSRDNPTVSPKKKMLCNVTYASDTVERPSFDRRLSCAGDLEHGSHIKGNFTGIRRNPSFIRRLFSEPAMGYKSYSNVKNNAKTIRTVFLVVGEALARFPPLTSVTLGFGSVCF